MLTYFRCLWAPVLWAVIFYGGGTSAVICSQCNMRSSNILNTCDKPYNVSGCFGCMKTLTKIKLRDSGYITGWERMSRVKSLYCMPFGAGIVKPEGCYKQLNNGGYTERCFCYTNYCNSGATRPWMGPLALWVSAGLSLMLLLNLVCGNISSVL